jgi:hypothetical protein
MNREIFGSFLMGVAIGFIVLLLLSSLPGTYPTMAREAIEKCEAELPRNQNCILTAIPAPVEKP